MHHCRGMKDLAITLDNRPGALADMGDALGRAGVSVEGGGAWVANGKGVAHFLIADADEASRWLPSATCWSSACARTRPGSSGCYADGWPTLASISKRCTATTPTS
jgi:hypothetical protein